MKLHDYQREARDFLLGRLPVHGGGGLWLDPGLGKTAVVLHTVQAMRLLYGLDNATIVAPARVLATSWPKEIKKWNMPLTWRWIKGDEAERKAAIDAKPDLWFLSAESLAKAVVDNSYIGDGFEVHWKNGQYVLSIGSEEHPFESIADLLAAYPQCESVKKKRWRTREQLPDYLNRTRFKSDLVVIDEITKFKSWSASRTKVLKRLIERMPLRIALTGTPVPNNLSEDIFPQQFMLDSGKTLGTSIGRFRDRWSRPCGYENRDFEIIPTLQDTLLDIISPWYLRQEILDHLDMPAIVRNEISVELPESAMRTYRQVEKEMYAELEQNELVALSGGSKYNLCRQIASGSAYDPAKEVVHIHDAKLEALSDLIEELNGKPLLIAYCFKHELLTLQRKWPKIEHISGGTKASDTARVIDGWRKGKIKLLAAQCQAMSHGVDGLQSGNDICWLTLTDQPEIRTQFEARLYRQGVEGDQVRFHYLLARGTLDKKVKRVLDDKDGTQMDVLRAVKGTRHGQVAEETG
jgi:SNF2 family DNA or RNA helicase